MGADPILFVYTSVWIFIDEVSADEFLHWLIPKRVLDDEPMALPAKPGETEAQFTDPILTDAEVKKIGAELRTHALNSLFWEGRIMLLLTCCIIPKEMFKAVREHGTRFVADPYHCSKTCNKLYRKLLNERKRRDRIDQDRYR